MANHSFQTHAEAAQAQEKAAADYAKAVAAAKEKVAVVEKENK